MEFFSKNLKFLRELKGLNQSEMFDFIGIKQSTWGGYETGKSFPSFKDFLSISKILGISETELLHSDLSKTHLNKKTKPQKDIEKTHLIAHPSAHLIEKNDLNTDLGVSKNDNKPNVYSIKSGAAAGNEMLLLLGDKAERVPDLYLSEARGGGTYILVPVVGDSMHSTIKNGDKALCKMIDNGNEIRSGNIYIVIDKDDGIVCKRLYLLDKGIVEFHSDNEIYKPYKRHLNDILGLFRVVEVHSTDLRPYWQDLRREMQNIRSEMTVLRKSLNSK